MCFGRSEECMRDDSSTRSHLTARECQVLRLIAAGVSTRQIASTLGISFKTAVTHRTRLMEKLGLHNVADVTRYALRQYESVPDSEQKQPNRELLDQLQAMKENSRATRAEHNTITEATKTAKWSADGAQALYHAATLERQAAEKYVQALEAFIDPLLR